MTAALDLPVAGPCSPLLARPGLEQPAFASVPEFSYTLGDEAGGFAADIGMPPDPQEQLALDIIFARDKRGKSAAYETGLVCCRQNLKALAADTPMLTTRGWSAMGELKPGDQVFHPGGYPVTVTGVSVPEVAHSCYRVTTTDGRSVVADAGHLWTVRDRCQRRGTRAAMVPVERVMTTAQMAGEGLAVGSTRERRFILPAQEPLKTPDVDLPVDPYLLGAWLGDGRSADARLYAHGDDVPHWVDAIAAAGFTAVPRLQRSSWEIGIRWPGPRQHANSLRSRLRALGVLGSKHVPDRYLTAGTGQRLAVLQGLLDTDGTIHHRSGQVTFTSILAPLAEAVLYLCRSLGWRAGFREARAVLDGRDCGPMFQVTFTPKTTDPFCPFRLPRKASRVRPGVRAQPAPRILSIEPVPSRPVRCIKVDAPDGLFLAGRDLVATHNTATFEMTALAWLYLFDEPLVVWSAHEYVTSQEAQFHMEGLILNSDLLRPKTARIVHANGSECIETVWGARMIFKTRTKTGGRGLSANKVVLDEAFALKSGHMGALLPTMSAKPDPQVLYGSSACLEDSEILAELVSRGRPGTEVDWMTDQPVHQVVAGPMATAYLEWCAPPPKIACDTGASCKHEKPKFDRAGNQIGGSAGCGCDKPAMWKLANPSVGIERPDGGVLTVNYIAAERKALPVDQFPRERMGWHDRVDGAASPLDAVSWAGCADRGSAPRPGSPLAVAFAVAPDGSAAAVAVAGWRADGLPHGELIEHLPGTGWLLEFLFGVWERRQPCCLVMDPMGPSGAFEKLLRQERGPAGAKTCFVTVPKDKPGPPKLLPGQRLLMVTSTREVAQGSGMLANAVQEGTFRHPDQKPLNEAARDVRKRDVAQAWAFDSPDGKDITPVQAVMLAQLGLATYGAKQPLAPFALT